MKKLLFGLAFMGAMMFSSVTLMAQEEEVPCPEGSTNSYGGVCCQSEEDCDHPAFGTVYLSTWTRCVSGC
uniref:hypothetical protein n=1 Tax=Algoriphagus locisalis TaxID=305507 RepID=UPI001113690F|nr:hypothetical protein [Algoriphagus locisalis]